MGFYGFSFMDLITHEYAEEEVKHNKPEEVLAISELENQVHGDRWKIDR